MTTEMQQKHNDRVDSPFFIYENSKTYNDSLKGNTHTYHTDTCRSYSTSS